MGKIFTLTVGVLLTHPQPATTIQTDNSTAAGVVNSNIQPQRTKAMDMRFHWLRDRKVAQKMFRIFWKAGIFNFADYWTKHHSALHHREMRPKILTNVKALEALRASKRARQGATMAQ